MRLAGYLGKVKLFEEHYYSIIRHSRSGYDQERLCTYWLPAQWDEARVNVLPASILPVTVYRLVAEGTIEEKILQLHEKKRDLADSLLTGTDVSAKLTA